MSASSAGSCTSRPSTPQHVYELLREAGEEFGIVNAGYRAIESCRLEKRYLYWGADITPDYNPYEAGLGFCVALDKGDFIGRDALQRAKAAGPKRRLCMLPPGRDPSPSTAARRSAATARSLGVTTSGGYGHTIGKSIVYGYVPADEAAHADYEIEAFCERVPAKRSPKAALRSRSQAHPDLRALCCITPHPNPPPQGGGSFFLRREKCARHHTVYSLPP